MRVMPVTPGSPNAVKFHSPRASSRGLPAGTQMRSGAAPPRSSGRLSKVAWIPQGDVGHADWLATGRRLGAIGRCSQWWIGDWVRYGTAKWGEKYTEAAKVTGYDPASLQEYGVGCVAVRLVAAQ